MHPLRRQLRRLGVHLVNVLQRHLLGDDGVSIVLRLKLLGLLGVRAGAGCKILGGSEFLGGKLTLGDKVFINRSCYFDFSGRITLQDGAEVGHGVTLITAYHAIGTAEKRAGPITPRDIVIGKGAWIGANATIMPGVTIGEGAVVGAAACVTKDVPANTVVAGVPARIMKQL